jgi:sulfur-oxidizing protein SoxZ
MRSKPHVEREDSSSATVKQGEVFSAPAHSSSMETGFRRDEVGRLIPQNVIKELFVVTTESKLFRADLFPGVAANPYLAFFTVADASGELEVRWTDDAGVTESEHIAITVLK